MDEYDLLFSKLNINEEGLKNEILQNSIIVTVPKQTLIVEQDKYIKWLAIVINGKVRVWQENEERQILLYYVEPVNTCVLSIAACFKNTKSVINAITETDTTLVKIPVQYVSEWNYKYNSWQKFIAFSFIGSYDELLINFRKLAFYDISGRLKDYLRNCVKLDHSNAILMSHSQLAKELGTTREVVSKTLKKFEAEGFLELQFKKIVLLKKFFAFVS